MPVQNVARLLPHPQASNSIPIFTAQSSPSGVRCVTRVTPNFPTYAGINGCMSTAGCRSSVTNVARPSLQSPLCPNIVDFAIQPLHPTTWPCHHTPVLLQHLSRVLVVTRTIAACLAALPLAVRVTALTGLKCLLPLPQWQLWQTTTGSKLHQSRQPLLCILPRISYPHMQACCNKPLHQLVPQQDHFHSCTMHCSPTFCNN